MTRPGWTSGLAQRPSRLTQAKMLRVPKPATELHSSPSRCICCATHPRRPTRCSARHEHLPVTRCDCPPVDCHLPCDADDTRGLVPLGVDLCPAAQDEVVKCTVRRAWRRALTAAERVGHLVQEPVPLPSRLRHAIPRPAVDLLRGQEPVQHRLQADLHLVVGIHHLPDAQRLQADARPQPGHVQSAVPARRERGAGPSVSLPLDGPGGAWAPVGGSG